MCVAITNPMRNTHDPHYEMPSKFWERCNTFENVRFFTSINMECTIVKQCERAHSPHLLSLTTLRKLSDWISNHSTETWIMLDFAETIRIWYRFSRLCNRKSSIGNIYLVLFVFGLKFGLERNVFDLSVPRNFACKFVWMVISVCFIGSSYAWERPASSF